MYEHAAEIVPFLTSVLGVLAIYVLNGIRDELKEFKNTVQQLEVDLRSGVSSLDRRITVVETTCKGFKCSHSQD